MVIVRMQLQNNQGGVVSRMGDGRAAKDDLECDGRIPPRCKAIFLDGLG
ncbi:hypothetical protein [Geitlerinema calcuttense]|uniref:Uncharacterized protein n=1 Tax=Geitlerinema calcuttense NRMC-F 0142 TaxID=2922238 RepID=A0ABT7M0A5_9CYAN|nr:hypothetical protein [Geitlerinema calcuttense]MDL5057694.1 hypothetical protein [Geitlerinema calcuttense NRMC-F 0142]